VKNREQPTVSSFERNLPDLFSFDIPADTADKNLNEWLKYFGNIRPQLNAIARGLPVTLKFVRSELKGEVKISPEELTKTLLCLKTGIDKMKGGKTFLTYEHHLRLRLAHIVFLDSDGQCEEITLVLEKITSDFEAYLNKYPQRITDELVWYLLVSIDKQTNRPLTSHDTLTKTLKYAQKLESSIVKESVYALVVNQLSGRSECYPPNYDVFSQLESLSPDVATHLPEFFAWLRHNYVVQNLEHKDYFDYQTGVAGELPLESNSYSFEIAKHQSILNKHLMIQLGFLGQWAARFAVHLSSPSPAILRIEIESCDEQEVKNFNQTLKEKMRILRWCNSGGFLKEVLFEENNFEGFRSLILSTYESTFGELNAEDKNALLVSISEDDYLDQNQSLLDIKSALAGINPINALILFHDCLIEVEHSITTDLLKPIRKLLSSGIEIAWRAEEINSAKIAYPEKNEQWFELAKQLVEHIVQGNTLLLQVGIPQKEGKAVADHMLYVIIDAANTPQHTLITIVNGGSGASKFHTVASSRHSKDRLEYNVAAFEPFNILDKQYRDALVHYVYRLINLRYTLDIEDALRSIYLRTASDGNQKEHFLAYQLEKNYVFKRSDRDAKFASQFTGNCTVHNLKNMLQFHFDMDELTFGLFQDNLLLGFDQMLTRLVQQDTSTSTAASSSAASSSSSDAQAYQRHGLLGASVIASVTGAVNTITSESTPEKLAASQLKN
jgi:hypothetical protein